MISHPPDQIYPGHAIDEDGGLSYDARCFWCREITAQPPPTAMPKAVKP